MNPQSIWNRILALPRLYSIGGAIVIVALIAIGLNTLTRSASSTEAPVETSHVLVASVATLSSPAGPLPVTGKVTSLSEATILAQTSGEITTLYHAIGDHVAAGALIATFENSSQQAAVLQAQGAYDAAEAAYQKVVTITAAGDQTTALAALASAYASLDDAVHAKADTMFSNPRTSQAQIVLTVPDSTLVNKVQNERVALEGTLTQAAALVQNPDSAAIDADVSEMTDAAQQTALFLTDLAQAVSETTQSQTASSATLTADQAAITAARTETVTAITALTSAKSSYDSAATASTTNASTASDIASAAAAVKQAQGALDGAKASLEKTLVRSPISGTIVSLPVTQGDFVNSFAQVAVVSNPGALYVDTEVTPDDAQTLAVGNGATIEDGVAGVITFIAPALDPTTDKIELKVGITGDQSALTDGEIVSVALNRSDKAISATAENNTAITIPIVAVKITPDGPVVFTVSTSSTLLATPITLGTILGDQVTVLTGLTPDLNIVTDARGLAQGQTVIVDAP